MHGKSNKEGVFYRLKSILKIHCRQWCEISFSLLYLALLKGSQIFSFKKKAKTANMRKYSDLYTAYIHSQKSTHLHANMFLFTFFLPKEHNLCSIDNIKPVVRNIKMMIQNSFEQKNRQNERTKKKLLKSFFFLKTFIFRIYVFPYLNFFFFFVKYFSFWERKIEKFLP